MTVALSHRIDALVSTGVNESHEPVECGQICGNTVGAQQIFERLLGCNRGCDDPACADCLALQGVAFQIMRDGSRGNFFLGEAKALDTGASDTKKVSFNQQIAMRSFQP